MYVIFFSRSWLMALFRSISVQSFAMILILYHVPSNNDYIKRTHLKSHMKQEQSNINRKTSNNFSLLTSSFPFQHFSTRVEILLRKLKEAFILVGCHCRCDIVVAALLSSSGEGGNLSSFRIFCFSLISKNFTMMMMLTCREELLTTENYSWYLKNRKSLTPRNSSFPSSPFTSLVSRAF